MPGGETMCLGRELESLAAPWQVLWLWVFKDPEAARHLWVPFIPLAHLIEDKTDSREWGGGNSSGTCSYSPTLHIAVLREVNNPQPQRQVG